jgi:hypothetical protein
MDEQPQLTSRTLRVEFAPDRHSDATLAEAYRLLSIRHDDETSRLKSVRKIVAGPIQCRVSVEVQP